MEISNFSGSGTRSSPSTRTSWRLARDSGAINRVGPKETARAFETKETAMSKRGVGFVAASGSRIKSYGEKKIIGYTEDGERMSPRIRADVKKVLGSVHKMNM